MAECAHPRCGAPATHVPRLLLWPASCPPAARRPARRIVHVVGLGLCADHAAGFDAAGYLARPWGTSGLTLRGAIARNAIRRGLGAPDWATLEVEAMRAGAGLAAALRMRAP